MFTHKQTPGKVAKQTGFIPKAFSVVLLHFDKVATKLFENRKLGRCSNSNLVKWRLAMSTPYHLLAFNDCKPAVNMLKCQQLTRSIM